MSIESQLSELREFAAKEKLACPSVVPRRGEIVIGAAPRLRRGFGGQAPHFQNLAGGFFRQNAPARPKLCEGGFGLIQEYCIIFYNFQPRTGNG
jgi:hypothetical protein